MSQKRKNPQPTLKTKHMIHIKPSCTKVYREFLWIVFRIQRWDLLWQYLCRGSLASSCSTNTRFSYFLPSFPSPQWPVTEIILAVRLTNMMPYNFFGFDKVTDQNYNTTATEILWCGFLITKCGKQPPHFSLLSETRAIKNWNQEIIVILIFSEIQRLT